MFNIIIEFRFDEYIKFFREMEYELISSDEDDTYPTSPSSNTEVNAEEAPMDPGTDLAYSATFSISMENSVSSQGYLSTVTAQLQTEVSFNDTTLQAESLVPSEIMVAPQYQEIPVIRCLVACLTV